MMHFLDQPLIIITPPLCHLGSSFWKTSPNLSSNPSVCTELGLGAGQVEIGRSNLPVHTKARPGWVAVPAHLVLRLVAGHGTCWHESDLGLGVSLLGLSHLDQNTH